MKRYGGRRTLGEPKIDHVSHIGERLQTLSAQDHQRTEALLNAQPDVVVPPCPKCDKLHMVVRRGPRGPFWGCTRFPICKGTRNLEVLQ